MELRRAVLLFAIVLGLAAVVTVISRPADRDERRDEPAAIAPPESSPRPSEDATPATVRFDGERAPVTRTVRVEQSASLAVEVPEAGDVRIPSLGLSASAEPGTPARFDVLEDSPGRHPVRFVLADGSAPRTLGTLVVRATR